MPKPQTASAVEANRAMSLTDAIRNRHAVRSYAPQTLSYEAIHALLKAAVLAPTAVHEEPWAFAVIENKETMKRLSDSAKKFMGDIERSIHVPGRHMSNHFTPPDDIFYGAPALIVIYGKPMGPFVAADCWLAAENLMLAATATGLGTCVIGLAVAALNTPEWKAELKVPAEMTAYAPIIVGVPSGETPATSRKEPQIFAWN
ncbi:MAG TPA: nitroreductase family protein [Alphaproteobacteria bacterium]|nr:nitroreductase family protein [Alphaproteobacteria bacterium]